MSQNILSGMNCPVCSEGYTECGEHTAKLLPCTHNVCKKCVENKLFQHFTKTLSCPVCSEEHYFCEGVEQVKNNDFISLLIEKNQKQMDLCSVHKKELNLFCKEAACQRLICVRCLKEDHKAHDFDDLETLHEEMPKRLKKEVEVLDKLARLCRDRVQLVRSQYREKNYSCLKQISVARQEVNRRFEYLEKQAKEHKRQLKRTLDEVKTDIKQCCSIIKSTEDLNGDEMKQLLDKRRDIEDMRKKLALSVPFLDSCTYLEYVPKNNTTLTSMFEFSAKKIRLPGLLENPLRSSENKARQGETTPNRKRGEVVNCQVSKEQLMIDYISIKDVCFLKDGSLVVGGRRTDAIGNWLSIYSADKFNLKGKVKFLGAKFTVVQVCGREKIVDIESKLTFYDSKKLFQDPTFCCPELTDWVFASVCTSSPSTLWFTNAKHPTGLMKLFKLDCSSWPFKGKFRTIATFDHVVDIACLQVKEERLLVTAAQCGKIRVFSTETGFLEWMVDLSGDERVGMGGVCLTGTNLTTNGHQMFAYTISPDGKVLGQLRAEDGKSSFSKPGRIRWCEKSSSLAVCHEENGQVKIRFLSVNQDHSID